MYTVDTGACDKRLGCELHQKQPEGQNRPIGFLSRSQTGAVRVYDTTHRKRLALVCAVLLPLLYLQGTRFTIQTDHDSLKFILNLAYATGKLA